ncbi:MAG: phosphoribosylformylglycinamidine cyclo-ligase [Candidatus Cloacimonadota bacterium]|nr:MAG: phosphoribosylformylglycinamidine cyclo-ligase [Candidatus Cloacimonadota bacterium]
MTKKMTYAESGVNIQAGEDSVNKIKPLVKKTFNKNVLTEIGSFGGLYQVDLEKWKKPVLVASTDGVGTKLMIAIKAGKYDTVGQDLVNHCVNDIFVQGAHPQFFLDYIGVGKLDPEIMEKIIAGFAHACAEHGMALIGGEMAEMPGIYGEDDFDLAGTIVGIVEKDNIVTGEKIKEGDVIIGYKSSGLHTNGYSLARKIIFEKCKLGVDSKIPGTETSVAEALLQVHISYYDLLKKYSDRGDINGMAHITGGGLEGNVKRVMPDGLVAEIDTSSWQIPDLFKFLVKEGNVELKEAFKAFNMGIGYVIMVDSDKSKSIAEETNGIIVGSVKKTEKKEKVCLKY